MSKVKLPLRNSPVDKNLWVISQVEKGSSRWNNGAPISGLEVDSKPAVTLNDVKGLEVFVRGKDNRLWHSYQLRPNGAWSEWYSLAGSADLQFQGNPAVGRNHAGFLEVLVRGQDNHLWCTSQQVDDKGNVTSWSDWEQIGNQEIENSPAVGRNGDGRLEVFSANAKHELVHTWQDKNFRWTGEWNSLSKPSGGDAVMSEIVVETDYSGLLEVFAGFDERKKLAAAGIMAFFGTSFYTSFHRIMQVDSGGGINWSPWKSVGEGTFFGAITAVRDSAASKHYLFTNRRIQHSEQNQLTRFTSLPNDQWKSDSLESPEIAGTPVAIGNPDGSIEIFASRNDDYLEKPGNSDLQDDLRDKKSGVYSKPIQHFRVGSDGNLSSVANLGGRISPGIGFTAITADDGRVHVFGVAEDITMPDWRVDKETYSHALEYAGIMKLTVDGLDGVMNTWANDQYKTIRIRDEEGDDWALYHVDRKNGEYEKFVAIQLASHSDDYPGAFWNPYDGEDHTLRMARRDHFKAGATNDNTFSLENHGGGNIALKILGGDKAQEYLYTSLGGGGENIYDNAGFVGAESLKEIESSNIKNRLFKVHGSHLPILVITGSGKQLDLSAEDFSGMTLDHVDFSEAQLGGARFCNSVSFLEANFTKANLSGAIFDEKSLGGGADFTGANFTNTDLSPAAASPDAKCSGADFSGANLSGLDLSGSDFSNANLSRANLDGANLSGANLSNALLVRSSLNGADLSNANLNGAVIANLDESDAGVPGKEAIQKWSSDTIAALAKLGYEEWKLDGTKFEGADLKNARLIGLDLTSIAPIENGPVFGRPDQQGQVPDRTVLAHCQLPYRLLALNWSGLDLTGSTVPDLQDHLMLSDKENPLNAESVILPVGMAISVFDSAVSEWDADTPNFIIRRANFKNATLNNGNLIGADLLGTDFTGADLRGTFLKFANLSFANFEDANLIAAVEVDDPDHKPKATDFTGAFMINASLKSANADDAIFTNVLFSTLEVDDGGAFSFGAAPPPDKDVPSPAGGASAYQAKFNGADFSNAILAGTNFDSAQLTSATMYSAILIGASFVKANLSPQSTEGGADGKATVLTDSDLRGADFSQANQDGTEESGTTKGPYHEPKPERLVDLKDFYGHKISLKLPN